MHEKCHHFSALGHILTYFSVTYIRISLYKDPGGSINHKKKRCSHHEYRKIPLASSEKEPECEQIADEQEGSSNLGCTGEGETIVIQFRNKSIDIDNTGEHQH